MSAQRSNSASGTKNQRDKRRDSKQWNSSKESRAFQISNLRERTQRDENDEVITSRYFIANTFAKCYNKLYAKEQQDEEECIEDEERMNDHTKVKVDEELIKKANENTEHEIENESPKDESEHIPDLTEQELQAAIDCLKRGNSGDDKGIEAEDVKGCDDETKKMMRKIFDEVIMHECITPEAWRKVTKNIFETGDEEKTENDRPTLYIATCTQCSLDFWALQQA